METPFDLYLLAGAVYGSYFEQDALDQIRAGSAGDAILRWARPTVQRYIHFASRLAGRIGPA